MPQTTITIPGRFCAGHRLMDYNGACEHLHGHNYDVVAEFTGSLDSQGMVADFLDVDRLVSGILKQYDHVVIAWEADQKLLAAMEVMDTPVKKIAKNSTAENLGEILFAEINAALTGKEYRLSKLTVSETPECHAIVTG